MKQRLRNSALIILSMLATLLVFKSLGGLLIAVVISTCALFEYYRILEHSKAQPYKKTGVVCGVVILTATFVWGSVGQTQALAFSVLLLFASFLMRSRLARNVSPTLLGILYVPFLLSFYLLCVREFGMNATFWMIITIKSSDLGGWLIGTPFGRTPLAPHISPQKTVEGMMGAIGISFLIGFLLSFMLPDTLHMWHIFLMMLVIVPVSIFSDLVESQMKRWAQMKNSGDMQGLGGVLDIIDSLLITAPVGYFILNYWI